MTLEKFDYLIIGSGIAGLFAALKAARKGKVALLTKRELYECNSVSAQGGISCVMGDINSKDTFESHVEDTLVAGAGLCNEAAVREIVTQAPQGIQDLIDFGVQFTTRGEVEENCPQEIKEEYDLGKEGGHSRRRILHAGDITGEELIRALAKACRNESNIDIYEHHHAIDLISTDHLGWGEGNQCLGGLCAGCRRG